MDEEDIFRTRARSYSKGDSKMAGKGAKGRERDDHEVQLQEVFQNGSEMNALKEMKKPVSEEDWWNVLSKLATAVTGLQDQLGKLKTMKGNVKTISSTWKSDISDNIDTLIKEGRDYDFKLKLLGNIIIRQDQKIKELESKMQTMQSKDLKVNIIIHGITEERNESYVELKEEITNFFKQQMEIEEDIEFLDAYRIDTKVDRPICVKLQHPSDKSIIFKHASNFKEKRNMKRKLFAVQDDQNLQQAEVHSYYHDLLKESKEQTVPDKKFTVKMAKGYIVVNGHNRIKQKLKPVEAVDIIRMSNEELEEV